MLANRGNKFDGRGTGQSQQACTPALTYQTKWCDSEGNDRQHHNFPLLFQWPVATSWNMIAEALANRKLRIRSFPYAAMAVKAGDLGAYSKWTATKSCPVDDACYGSFALISAWPKQSSFACVKKCCPSGGENHIWDMLTQRSCNRPCRHINFQKCTQYFFFSSFLSLTDQSVLYRTAALPWSQITSKVMCCSLLQ